MPELIEPTVRLKPSFLAGAAEFQAEGRGASDDDSALGHDIAQFAADWNSDAGFAAYVDYLLTKGDPTAPLAPGRVPQTTFWYVDGSEYLASIRIRHALNEYLLEVAGGHIGYDVRPSERRKGYATSMFRGALGFAGTLGIDPALVTCDETNVGSRRVIEANGGVLEDIRDGQMRFWVPTPR